MKRDLLEEYRSFLKNNVRLTLDFSQTDQNRGISPPPIEKPFAADSKRIDLVAHHRWRNTAGIDLISAIQNRRSQRHFRPEPLTLEELSFLFWAAQGLQKTLYDGTALRTVTLSRMPPCTRDLSLCFECSRAGNRDLPLFADGAPTSL